jgi:ssDNA-binding replication factor A large subunit
MAGDNYDRIIEKISKISNVSKEEIERKIEAKRAKLSGLISKEGAAQVVAAELGISFDNEKLKIEELLPGMRKVNVTGKVVNIYPARTFKTKTGEDGKVANMFIADETSNIKVVLWDTNAIALLENGKIGEGSVVEILNGSMRDNEIHLGSFSELKISDSIMDEVKSGRIFREKKISELKSSDNAKVRAFIVQSFEPRFFYVCPSCKKKAVQEGDGFICAEHGKVAAEKRSLINIILDDGTETIRTGAFQDNLAGLGLIDLENTEELIRQRESLLGKEMFFHGTVRNNKVFNTPEFIIDKVEIVNPELLIKELETN